jgi:hypothetical protein
MPITLYPDFKNTRATELITELIPGAGPPPQSIATDSFILLSVKKMDGKDKKRVSLVALFRKKLWLIISDGIG